jgi:regulator of replication initiation timing
MIGVLNVFPGQIKLKSREKNDILRGYVKTLNNYIGELYQIVNDKDIDLVAEIQELRSKNMSLAVENQSLKNEPQVTSDLVEENERLKLANETLDNQIKELTSATQKDDYVALETENQQLKDNYAALKVENQKLKEEYLTFEVSNQELKDELERTMSTLVQKIKNERNAGRKTIITPELTNNILTMSKEGNTQMAISKQLGVSFGLVNKILQANRNKQVNGQ